MSYFIRGTWDLTHDKNKILTLSLFSAKWQSGKSRGTKIVLSMVDTLGLKFWALFRSAQSTTAHKMTTIGSNFNQSAQKEII